MSVHALIWAVPSPSISTDIRFFRPRIIQWSMFGRSHVQHYRRHKQHLGWFEDICYTCLRFRCGARKPRCSDRVRRQVKNARRKKVTWALHLCYMYKDTWLCHVSLYCRSCQGSCTERCSILSMHWQKCQHQHILYTHASVSSLVHGRAEVLTVFDVNKEDVPGKCQDASTSSSTDIKYMQWYMRHKRTSMKTCMYIVSTTFHMCACRIWFTRPCHPWLAERLPEEVLN